MNPTNRFERWFRRDYIALHIPSGLYLCSVMSMSWPVHINYNIDDTANKTIFYSWFGMKFRMKKQLEKLCYENCIRETEGNFTANFRLVFPNEFEFIPCPK